MQKNEIEHFAIELTKYIHKHAEVNWAPEDVKWTNILTPKAACEVLGLEYYEQPIPETFGYKGFKIKTAGCLDRSRKVVIVEESLPIEVKRFTAMHEVAHYLLHKGEVMHRDRPIDDYIKVKLKRDPIEIEADFFAACFLMPEKQIIEQFKYLLDTSVPLKFTEELAIHLCPRDHLSLLRAEQNSLLRELALASCNKNYRYKRVDSLAERFQVSNHAMAIRIAELKLITWP